MMASDVNSCFLNNKYNKNYIEKRASQNKATMEYIVWSVAN